MKRITVIVPVYNEEENINALIEAVGRVFSSVPAYAYEILFVDDGSTDEGRVRIEAAVESGAQVRLIELSRNFGKEAALSAGLAHARGDAVILMDADLQHPPELIPQFIHAWEGGADVVIGVRKKNPDENMLRALASNVFARTMRAAGDVPTVRGATDFRLLDRTVVDAFKNFTEHGRMTRGLIDWLGFRRVYVSFNANARHAGKARYSGMELCSLAVSAFIAHSMLPLRLAGYLGVLIVFFSGPLGLFILVEQLILGDPMNLAIPATAMLAVMILFLNGVMLVCLGLVSLYIERIHQEAMARPLYVLRMRNEQKAK